MARRSSLLLHHRFRGAFDPTSIAGLQLWLDAADTSTITESSGSVSQWDDKSGNNHDATQSTAADQPSTGVATLNGRNVVSFTADEMTFANPVEFSRLDDQSVFIVVELLSTTTSASTGNFVFRTDGTNDQWLIAFGSVTNELTNERWSWIQRTPTIYGYGEVTTDIPSGAHVFTHAWNAATSTVYMARNGSQVSVVASNSGGFDSSNTDLHPYAMLGTSSEIRIAEILIYDSALSTADREAVEGYLAAKWGIAL